ncbi:type II toxin-antitoxin system VapC family toxin [Pricia sp.]|uniref:type II toxin-antitoxin system VapC family toxin n=1 Tax=Pricia sp. TaxID=2268138 RepID=UPI0035943805
MKLLLDTHAVIWLITGDERLPKRTKAIIENKDNTSFVSIASLWEMGIKHSLGKLNLKTGLSEIFDLIDESGLNLLSITPSHILTNTTLDFHNKDPFDRLIISQAQCEGFTVDSKDGLFKNYKIKLLWEK